LLAARSGRGQSVVELALFLPLIFLFGLVCIQFAIIFMAYMNVVNATRDAARWTTVHPNTTDGDVQTNVRNRRPPGLVATNLSFTFSPACASLTSGICSGRTRDTMLVTTGTYVNTPHIFLPTSFGMGRWTVQIPVADLTYALRMQVEPI
jgi:Flp pilus assembly protein TadG